MRAKNCPEGLLEVFVEDIAIQEAVLRELAGLARVPEYAREAFFDAIDQLLAYAHGGWLFRSQSSRLGDASFLNAERAVRDAHLAVRALSPAQWDYLRESIEAIPASNGDPDNGVPAARDDWDYMLTVLVMAFAKRTGKTPFVAPVRGRGRRRGTVGNYPFQSFVRELWRQTERYGGRLSFSPKNGGSGAMLKALAVLEPCLPSGLVPKALPLSTIERIRQELKDTPF
jgi:hypothetical protein